MGRLVKLKKDGALYMFSNDGSKTRIYGNSTTGYFLSDGTQVNVSNPNNPDIVNNIHTSKLVRKQSATKQLFVKKKSVPKRTNSPIKRNAGYISNAEIERAAGKITLNDIVKSVKEKLSNESTGYSSRFNTVIKDEDRYYSNTELPVRLSDEVANRMIKQGANVISLTDNSTNLVDGRWIKSPLTPYNLEALGVSIKKSKPVSRNTSNTSTRRPKLVPKKNPIYKKAALDNGQYTVVRGDTLSSISRRYNIPLADIVSRNPLIKDINRIYVGDKIQIDPLKFTRPVLEVSLNTTVSTLPSADIQSLPLSEADQYAVNNYGRDRWDSLSDKLKEQFRQQYNINIKPNLL